MRRLIAASFVALLTACGSSTPTDGNIPPPSPPAGTPASVVVTAGDGQQAEPGTPVALTPSVIVKDAAGGPVSGVAVNFVADSGGGSVTGGSAVTGSNGVAVVGSWTLGAAEGRNVLKVTVGTLAPVRIAATAIAAATATFPAMSIGAGGGSVVINQAGPLHGFSLTLPGGAFAGATEWIVSYNPNTTLPRTSGINPITPLIDLSSSTGGYASSYMTLTIPVTVPADMTPFVVLRDPATGHLEVLATTAVTATSISAVTQHLNGDHLVGSGPARSLRRGANLRGNYDIQVFVTGLKQEQLDADYDTGFRPGTDDWATQSIGTYPAPDGVCAGLTITAMWYFVNQKQNIGQLYGRFALAPGVYTSVKVGLDWATEVQLQLEGNDFKPLNDYLDQIVRAGNVGTRDHDFFNVLKAQLLITGAPQFIVTARNIKDKFAHAVIAWKTAGGTIYVADPNFPGDATNKILFGGTRFTPYEAPERKGEPPITFPFISTIGLSQLVPLDLLNDQWPSVADSSIGRNLFPAYSFKSKYGTFPTDTVWLSDTLRIWYECPSCRPLVTSLDVPEAVGSLTTDDEYLLSPSSATWSRVGESFLVAGQNASTSPRHSRLVFADDIYGPIEMGNQEVASWLDWHQYIRLKVDFTIAPKPVTGVVGVPVDMHGVLASGVPAHLAYVWDFGDDTEKQRFTDNPAASHTYTDAGTYTVIAQLLDPRTQQMISADTTTATILTPYIDLTVSGNWAENTAPAAGSYHYTDFSGGRVPNASPGVDALVGTYDNTAASNGIILPLVIPAGSALHAGQTFTKFVTGPPIIGPGQFQLTIMVKLNDPDNSHQVAPGTSGTFTVTAITIAADGTGFFSYTFEVSNGAGGTISGSGVSPYK